MVQEHGNLAQCFQINLLLLLRGYLEAPEEAPLLEEEGLLSGAPPLPGRPAEPQAPCRALAYINHDARIG